MAAIHVAGVRGDPCGAVQRTAPQGAPLSLKTGKGEGTDGAITLVKKILAHERFIVFLM